MKKTLTTIALLVSSQANAGWNLACPSTTYCQGPAQELVTVLETSGSAVYVTLPTISKDLACGTANGSGKKLKILNTTTLFKEMMSQIFTTTATNSGIRFVISSGNANCDVVKIATQPY